MRTIELDLTQIQTVRALHLYLAYRLDFPPHYGKNLDALFDCLCEVSQPLRLRVASEPVASEEMRAYLPRLNRVMEDAASENPNLAIEKG